MLTLTFFLTESKLISKLPSSNLGIANWGVNVLEDMNFSF